MSKQGHWLLATGYWPERILSGDAHLTSVGLHSGRWPVASGQ